MSLSIYFSKPIDTAQLDIHSSVLVIAFCVEMSSIRKTYKYIRARVILDHMMFLYSYIYRFFLIKLCNIFYGVFKIKLQYLHFGNWEKKVEPSLYTH